MPVDKLRRGPARGKAGFPNANSIRIDNVTDAVKVGTGASGTTEKTLFDSATPGQALAGVLGAALLAATGSVQGDAAPIVTASHALIHATGADGTKGIQLPTAVAGKVFFIKNQDSANAILKVWPFSGDAINAIAADSAISMAAKTAAVFIAIDATTWFTFSLLPS